MVRMGLRERSRAKGAMRRVAKTMRYAAIAGAGASDIRMKMEEKEKQKTARTRTR
jgi:hypothetical protein